MSRFRNITTVAGGFAGILAIASVGHSGVVYTEPFDDLSGWTVLDSDGAGTSASIEAVGGRLHVIDNDTNPGLLDHGLMAGQVAPLAGARFYVWGLENTSDGFVGNINLSSSTGLYHESASTPMGIYARLNAEPEFLRRIDGDSTSGPAVPYSEDTNYDLMIDYDGSDVSHYYKLSSSSTWIQIGSATAYTPAGGDYYLNITSLGRAFTIGVDSDWYIDQIDITDLNHAVLTAPVPEPAAVGAAMIGAVLSVRRRSRR